MDATKFDRNQIKEFITRVEDDTAVFIGWRFRMARLAGFVERQRTLGEVSNECADQLLADLDELGRANEIGQQYAKWVRNPPAEVELLVLTKNKRAA